MDEAMRATGMQPSRGGSGGAPPNVIAVGQGDFASGHALEHVSEVDTDDADDHYSEDYENSEDEDVDDDEDGLESDEDGDQDGGSEADLSDQRNIFSATFAHQDAMFPAWAQSTGTSTDPPLPVRLCRASRPSSSRPPPPCTEHPTSHSFSGLGWILCLQVAVAAVADGQLSVGCGAACLPQRKCHG